MRSACARGPVDRGRDAAALGWAAGGEPRPLPDWATGVVREAVAPGWCRGPPEIRGLGDRGCCGTGEEAPG